MAVAERWRTASPLLLSTAECLHRVEPILREHVGVQAAYLFGSRAGRSALPASDIDLAIWTDNTFVWQDFYELRAQITGRLRSERVDLVWLDRADPVFPFQVLATGRLLFYRDPDRLNERELNAIHQFRDYRLYLERRRRWRIDGLPA
jgi:predicted nucleotidyltransferase